MIVNVIVCNEYDFYKSGSWPLHPEFVFLCISTYTQIDSSVYVYVCVCISHLVSCHVFLSLNRYSFLEVQN